MKIPVLIPNIFDHPFTYESEINVNKGDYITVPFGKSKKVGVVWDNFEKQSKKNFKLKKIIKKLQIVPLNSCTISFLNWFSEYNLIPKGMALKLHLLSGDAIEKYKDKDYEIYNTSFKKKYYQLTDDQEKVLWERELLGIEMTESPFSKEMKTQPENVLVYASDLTNDMINQKKAIIGQVNEIRELFKKNNEKFLSVDLSLLDGNIELIVWTNILEKNPEAWVKGNFISITGVIKDRFNQLTIHVDKYNIYELNKIEKNEGTILEKENTTNFNSYNEPKPTINDQVGNINKENINQDTAFDKLELEDIHIKIKDTGNKSYDEKNIEEIFDVCAFSPGNRKVILEIASQNSNENPVQLEIPHLVDGSSIFFERIKSLTGQESRK